ncbi:hypothetical protein [Herbiconiux liangxiaofengii]|uniref:hypothetical protein n=1 Tax=Herbiconiux liangxiaofengii TaxID=3342795 RepID=UPI0035B95922
MSPVDKGSYTAKFTDGPLEGKTIRTDFTDAGEPQARLSIPAASSTKQYLYRRASGLEFADSDRPSAVDYRYVEAVVS